MLKVKCFSSSTGVLELEQKINEWVFSTDNEVTSVSHFGNGTIFTALVLYKEFAEGL